MSCGAGCPAECRGRRLDWMVEEQGMPEPEERARILDDLGRHLNPDVPRP